MTYDNTRYQILTDTGFCDFNGLLELSGKAYRITFDDNSEIVCSLDHKFFSPDGTEITATDLEMGSVLKSAQSMNCVLSKELLDDDVELFDIIGVDNETSSYYTNNILSHNCDELAFVPERIQEDFIAAVSPALSTTRGKLLVTSTPNGTKNLFAKMWFGSGMLWNDQSQFYMREGTKLNNFEPLFVPYWLDPTKDEEWEENEKRTLGDETKWRVEFKCLGGETTVEIMDPVTNEIQVITLEELHTLMNQDELIDGTTVLT